MRKTLVWCLVSALLGGVVALKWNNPPELLHSALAQAPVFPPADAPPAFGTVPGPGGVVPGTVIPAPGPAIPPVGPVNPDDELTPEERVSVGIYENCNRSVVYVTTESVQSDGLLFTESSHGEGSGSVITKEGHILTNYHVVEGAKEIQVSLFDGKTYDAKLVGSDPTVDVAVVKIEAPADSLHPVTFGDSSRLRVGQRVFAIGNPFGLERTLSTGIISSLNRSIPSRRSHRSIKQMIQIDAAINPGNSGGPLLDSHGRIIGMNTAIASKTGESAGVGFAIPISTIARVVPQLIQKGRVVRPDPGIAKVYQTEKGLLIAALVPGGPAERAGLRGPRVTVQRRRQGPFVYDYQTVDRSAADLIVGVDGQTIRTADEFLTLIEARQPNSQVMLNIVREGRRVQIPLVLGVGEE